MKFLIVDDEVLVRRSLGRALKSRGHEVIEAVDGSDGLEKWKAEKPDLVFLDILMPGMTGPQVLEALGDEVKAKVILMSAYAGGEDLEKAVKARADAFLSKPFDDIFDVIRKAEELVS